MATASQSLFNMTVAADNATNAQGLLMPKLQYRFRALFLNFGVGGSTTELTKQVMDITRPQVQFDEVAYMGDGIFDAKIIRAAKLGIAPAQARLEAKQAAMYLMAIN